MTTIGKFYLHAAVTDVSGTLPGASSIAAVAPSALFDQVNRKMDDVIGTAQTSKAYTTISTSSAQSALMGRFVSSPIAAQTIPSQGVTVSCAGSENSGQSNFQMTFSLAVWRPSTGAIVGRIADRVATATEYNTTQTSRVASVAASTAVTALDGDVLILEVWRASVAQGTTTPRTNTIFYDGTTELSSTSDAAYLSFVTDPIIMYSAPVTDPTDYWGAAA